MSAPQTLLPRGHGAFEEAVSLTSAERRPLDTDIIRRVRDPWSCPVEVLPFLAHALGVRLWFEDWSEYRKRLICAQALTLRAQEGTLAGAEGYLSFVDTTILRALRPPEKIYLAGGLSDADREAYVSHLPQIRIYPFQDRVIPPRWRSFLGARRAFLGSMFVQASRGPKLYGRRATIQRPGAAELPAQVDEVALLGQASIERITITGTSTRRTFLGTKRSFLGHMFLQASRVDSLTATVRLSDDALTAFVALSGSTVQSVRPVRVEQTRTAPVGRFFLGRDFLGASRPHLRSSNGAQMIFDRIALLDPSVEAPLRKGRSFLGHARFGVRPYTAELLVEIPMKRSRWRVGLGRGAFLRGFLRPADLAPLTRARSALAAARAVDDTILLDTQVYRTIRLNDGLRLGSFKLGEIRRRI